MYFCALNFSEMSQVRLRFAPSPTGPLHIGGVRTALYNYLYARKQGGTFILRIEDTDQGRYVEGAEQYIIDSLQWLGLEFDESPAKGGDFGPYRQSERKHLYKQYTDQLIASGHAYYAFDSSEDLAEMRKRYEAEGVHSPKYDASTRTTMKNSLTLDASEVESLLAKGQNIVVRLKLEPGQDVEFSDVVRGDVSFNTTQLDDKVLLKADGMPTYHMANIVDDYLMKISHVVRGEEWLSSTAHHVLLYRALGWEESMPKFAHLPLILNPTGKGKLSKRAGAKFGFPVFPLSWKGETEEESFEGFKDFGFDADATLNFLAFLGWNPGTEEEIFDLESLVKAFDLEDIVKAGARFDIDKAKWYNQQYIIAKSKEELLAPVQQVLKSNAVEVSDDFAMGFIELMKERVMLIPEFYTNAPYFFTDQFDYDEKTIRKKWKENNIPHVKELFSLIGEIEDWTSETLQDKIKGYITSNELSFGNILPFVRVATAGTMKGPDVFAMMALLGKEDVIGRLNNGLEAFDRIKNAAG